MKHQVLVEMMINRKKILTLLFIVCTLTFYKTGNAQTTDFRLRAGLGIQKEITKKLDASVDYEHRFNNNLTTFDQALIEPSVSYTFIKSLSIGAEWRFMIEQDQIRRLSYKNRGTLFIRYKKSIGDFDLKLKTAIQYGFDELTVDFFSYQKKIINRNTISIDYNWFGTKFTPFAGYEFFYHINNPNGGIINKSRLKLGTTYRISRASEISAYYIFENEFNVAYPVDANIIGFSYDFKF
jgi:hypothetical protein